MKLSFIMISPLSVKYVRKVILRPVALLKGSVEIAEKRNILLGIARSDRAVLLVVIVIITVWITPLVLSPNLSPYVNLTGPPLPAKLIVIVFLNMLLMRLWRSVSDELSTPFGDDTSNFVVTPVLFVGSDAPGRVTEKIVEKSNTPSDVAKNIIRVLLL